MTITRALLLLFFTYASIVYLLYKLNIFGSTAWTIFVYVSIILLGSAVIYIRNRKWWHKPKGAFPQEWKRILQQEVSFYKAISDTGKQKFEKKILFFLSNYKISGIGTEVETLDKLLIASASIIPTFQKARWRYYNLEEILLYPNGFSFENPILKEKIVMEGLVGGGPLEGKMILSQKALRKGFEDEADNHNTAIHEFVHLIDKSDGVIDGVPEVLLKTPFLLKLRTIILNAKINRLFARVTKDIENEKSDIRPYGAANKAEFLSVASEYFFENPEMMKEKHPDLHQLMQQIYRTPQATQKELSKN